MFVLPFGKGLGPSWARSGEGRECVSRECVSVRVKRRAFSAGATQVRFPIGHVRLETGPTGVRLRFTITAAMLVDDFLDRGVLNRNPLSLATTNGWKAGRTALNVVAAL